MIVAQDLYIKRLSFLKFTTNVLRLCIIALPCMTTLQLSMVNVVCKFVVTSVFKKEVGVFIKTDTV
jgi:hypothetical protein